VESGERRWESASRAIDFGDDATNFLIKRLVAEVSLVAMVGNTTEKKRWACLLIAAKHLKLFHLIDKFKGGDVGSER